MKKFFKKASRPTRIEKELVNEITELITKAEKINDITTLEAFKKTESCIDEMGLRKILAAIKFQPGYSSDEKDNDNNNNESTNSDMGNEKLSSEQEIKFEPMIDIQNESQFNDPVIPRENLNKQHGHDDMNEGEERQEYPQEEEGNATIEDAPYEPPGDEEEGSGDDTGGGLKDMPPETKKKAIKKSSEILAKVWSTVLPKLGGYIAKVSPNKIQRMALAKEIDPNMELFDGKRTITVAGVFEEHNAKVDAMMVITPTMEDEFREALKDVLEEKQVAMTPSQRLFSVMGAQIFTILGTAGEMKFAMYQQMKDFKQFHRENMEKADRDYAERNPPAHTPPPPPSNPPPSDGNKIKNDPPKNPPPPDNDDNDHIMTINPDDIKTD